MRGVESSSHNVAHRLKRNLQITNNVSVKGTPVLAPYTIQTEHSPRILTATCDKKSDIMGQKHNIYYTLKTRSHSRIKSSELTAANRRIANTHSSDLRMKLP